MTQSTFNMEMKPEHIWTELTTGAKVATGIAGIALIGAALAASIFLAGAALFSGLVMMAYQTFSGKASVLETVEPLPTTQADNPAA